jgi:hypothetical protein
MDLKQSTQVDVVLGPVWDTETGAIKANLAHNAPGIKCYVHKNGVASQITLAGAAGNGYFRASSAHGYYILTLSTGNTDTRGMAEIALYATGYYSRPKVFRVLHANVYDALFGSTALATVGAKMDLVDAPNTTAREAFRTTMQAAGTTLATLLSRIVGTLAIGTHNPQSGDAYARLGAPVGASVSADIANVPTADENADALLKRDWTYVTGAAARSVLNALRLLRNRVDTTTTPGTLTVCEEDDSTPAWTAAITTDAAAEPITEIDPA